MYVVADEDGGEDEDVDQVRKRPRKDTKNLDARHIARKHEDPEDEGDHEDGAESAEDRPRQVQGEYKGAEEVAEQKDNRDQDEEPDVGVEERDHAEKDRIPDINVGENVQDADQDQKEDDPGEPRYEDAGK